MEESKQPLSTIETFIKYHDTLYPKNQGLIWEDDFPWSQENESSSITDKKEIIPTSAYMIQQDVDLSNKGLRGCEKIKLKRKLLIQTISNKQKRMR